MKPSSEIAAGIVEYHIGDCACEQDKKCRSCQMKEDIKEAIDNERAAHQAELDKMNGEPHADRCAQSRRLKETLKAKDALLREAVEHLLNLEGTHGEPCNKKCEVAREAYQFLRRPEIQQLTEREL